MKKTLIALSIFAFLGSVAIAGVVSSNEVKTQVEMNEGGKKDKKKKKSEKSCTKEEAAKSSCSKSANKKACCAKKTEENKDK